ncbi:hypothetical protein [Phenylobacterium deserti]|uniref:Anti-sigma factor n=1 Tax=Phenylobacterium deserti TaxID=1914756 RepID=A0A328AQ37_9CAUL|nr:hypothetical protein [Phenylobacterium deserti]RAK56707.1 hypothetical protein DJ018_01645 [Phenylobacterium deserti]
MNRERFEELAQAYGGQVARWPESERDAAALLMAAEPEYARRTLAEAEQLDAFLDAWRPKPASAALMDTVLAAAPKPRREPRWRGWLMPAGLGAGLAAACAAGVLFGVQLEQRATGANSAGAAVAELDLSGLSEDV